MWNPRYFISISFICFILSCIILFALHCLWNCNILNAVSEEWNGCVDEGGNAVDWFIIYKLPREQAQVNLNDGTAYMYILAPKNKISSPTGWVVSNTTIDKSDSLPAKTLARIYQDVAFTQRAAILMYNDEWPNGTTSMTHGHSKGVLTMTSSGGYWLIHSVPKYPPSPEHGYSYPDTGRVYGQSMMCISIPFQETDNLGWQLIQNNPFMYVKELPDTLVSQLPVLFRVMVGETPTSAPFWRTTQLVSSAGEIMVSFAKYKKFDQDLYDGLVAQSLKSSLLVESWRNGPDPLSSDCSFPYKVQNIQEISVSMVSDNFTTHRDHSKWAVTQDVQKPYVCIGDINRMKTQFRRAGGTVCVRSETVWHEFTNLVESVEQCPGVTSF